MAVPIAIGIIAGLYFSALASVRYSECPDADIAYAMPPHITASSLKKDILLWYLQFLFFIFKPPYYV
jgi:hypothetical protein